jgi:hypothetical protein
MGGELWFTLIRDGGGARTTDHGWLPTGRGRGEVIAREREVAISLSSRHSVASYSTLFVY